MIFFHVFKAIDSPQICQKFAQGHLNVLKDYGITNISTNNNTWMTNKNIYGIIAFDQNHDVVGGIRIQIADGEIPLPMEVAVGKIDKKVLELVKSLKSKGIAELCALWNAKKVSGLGVSLLLMRAGIALANQLKIAHMVAICGQHTIEMVRRVGFRIDVNVGNDGYFPYPSNEHKANIVGIIDVITLKNAYKHDKLRITDIRENPIQSTSELTKKGRVLIKYHNLIPKSK